jgi:hypothetical protein
LSLPSCSQTFDNSCKDSPFRAAIKDENSGNSPLDFPFT